jgi:hypothetical protein
MSSPLVQSAERSPYTSFLASIDPVRAAQLPPPAVAKRKADQPPPEEKEAEGTTHDQRSYAVNGLTQVRSLSTACVQRCGLSLTLATRLERKRSCRARPRIKESEGGGQCLQ